MPVLWGTSGCAQWIPIIHPIFSPQKTLKPGSPVWFSSSGMHFLKWERAHHLRFLCLNVMPEHFSGAEWKHLILNSAKHMLKFRYMQSPLRTFHSYLPLNSLCLSLRHLPLTFLKNYLKQLKKQRYQTLLRTMPKSADTFIWTFKLWVFFDC